MLNYPVPLLPPGKEEFIIRLSDGRGSKFCFKSISLFVFLVTSLFNSLRCQPVNYPALFGDDWKNATIFERDNRNWMKPAVERYHLSYHFAVAVIFPELVRYSALRDKMEITLLKALYINLGTEYANFSIGQFQMKPSFAENVLAEIPADLARKSRLNLKQISDFEDIRSFRRSIITDMEDTRAQFKYLIAFLLICDKKFKTDQENEILRLKFISTVYNYGIDKSAADINSMTDRKFFNTKLFKTENYSYADVSLFWYKDYKSKE